MVLQENIDWGGLEPQEYAEGQGGENSILEGALMVYQDPYGVSGRGQQSSSPG